MLVEHLTTAPVVQSGTMKEDLLAA